MTIDDATLERLVELAREASSRAYCPYSRFRVGAAVLTDDGAMTPGCNVENASYGLTLCAERVAIFRAVADGRRRVRAVAVYTPTPGPTAPCGACRQVVHEFGPDALIVCVCDGPNELRTSLADLLPLAFGPDSL